MDGGFRVRLLIGVLAAAAVVGAVAVAVDTDSSPSVSWLTPGDGDSISGRLDEQSQNCTVSATSSSGIDRVSFYLDGRLLNTEHDPPYSCVWDTTTVAEDGPHTLKAVASDESGNSVSASVGVSVRKGEDYGAIPHTGVVVKQDLAPDPYFMRLWHNLNPDKPSQVEWHMSGGDPHPLIEGSTNSSWRRLVIHDGDRGSGDSSSRKRLQLGANSASDSNTFKAYREGERWITYWSMRIPSVNIPAGEGAQVWQMYQQGGSGPPILAFGHRSNDTLRLIVRRGSDKVTLWNAHVPVDTWLRFAIAVHYTRSPGNAEIQLWGDLGDSGDLSLKKLTPVMSGYPTLATGASALIAGIYGDAAIPEHHIDFANWQVAKWTP